MKILIVEDDALLQTQLLRLVRTDGHEAQGVGTLSLAKEIWSSDSDVFQLVILDWMLPDGQGLDFLKTIRIESTQNNDVPVILLTARADIVDKVVGLETGANDYMTKPFEPRELLARIRVQERQSKKVSHSESKAENNLVKKSGLLEMHLSARRAFYRGIELELTKMEYDLLLLFVENENKVFTRDELLNRVWGFESYPTTRTVDTHVFQLRQKTDVDHFETVRGVGYRYLAELTKK